MDISSRTLHSRTKFSADCKPRCRDCPTDTSTLPLPAKSDAMDRARSLDGAFPTTTIQQVRNLQRAEGRKPCFGTPGGRCDRTYCPCGPAA